MKTIRYIFASLAAVLFFYGCDQGIDDITEVAQGTDASAPQITINSPTEGQAIKVFEDVTSLDIDIEVTDDIEIESISVLLNGSEIAKFNNFKDYRRALEEFTYDDLVDGDHTLAVKATDIEGKTTTVEVNFSKQPPYTQMFDGELLYMPFDGDYRDQIGFEKATEIGSPGFSGDGHVGSNAYAGATDSYLTFPSDGLTNTEFSATMWYKLNNDPNRAGILVMGPPDPEKPDTPNNRKNGFRFFREDAAGMQRFKLNVGNGTADTWVDGGAAADVDPTNGNWVHLAFTISSTDAVVYIDGVQVAQSAIMGVDWTGCDVLSIMSGAPRFTEWSHWSDKSYLDDLRVFNKALSQTEIQIMINSLNPYIPKYAGESFYMPFDGDYIDLVGSTAASPIGTPDFTDDSYEGSNAYIGATDSYLTYPSDGLTTSEFSASMWYKLNNDPDRAGILVMGPPDPEKPDTPNNRKNGFRFFREDAAGMQRFKLNVGNGTADTWVDGGDAADVDPTTGNWVHLAFTISSTDAVVYIDGVQVAQSAITGVDWTGCDVLSIMSGAPRFTEWNHFSDNSILDELRLFNKALTAEEVAEMAGGVYIPPNYGAMFYIPFDGTNTEFSGAEPTVEGTPGFAGESIIGTDAYAGAADSYLTFSSDGLTTSEFSASMWYKLNNDPDRAGILVMGPPDPEKPDTPNNRKNGFRFFREDASGMQRFKLNVGDGTADTWVDGGDAADVDPTTGNWVHLAFTISSTDAVVYIDGVQVAQSAITGVDWTGCDVLSIMSGAPRFIEWNHLSDLSYLDDLHLFDKALTQEEIQEIRNDGL